MKFTKISEGIRCYFLAELVDGTLATGIAPGDMVATAVAPDLTTGTITAVAEVAAKGGSYTFLVPSSFLVVNGVGTYLIVVEVDSSSPKIKANMLMTTRISVRDIDDVFKVSQAILGNVV